MRSAAPALWLCLNQNKPRSTGFICLPSVYWAATIHWAPFGSWGCRAEWIQQCPPASAVADVLKHFSGITMGDQAGWAGENGCAFPGEGLGRPLKAYVRCFRGLGTRECFSSAVFTDWLSCSVPHRVLCSVFLPSFPPSFPPFLLTLPFLQNVFSATQAGLELVGLRSSCFSLPELRLTVCTRHRTRFCLVSLLH